MSERRARWRPSKAHQPSPPVLARALRETVRRALALRLKLDALQQEHARLAAALGTDSAATLLRDEYARFQRARGVCAICLTPVDDHAREEES